VLVAATYARLSVAYDFVARSSGREYGSHAPVYAAFVAIAAAFVPAGGAFVVIAGTSASVAAAFVLIAATFVANSKSSISNDIQRRTDLSPRTGARICRAPPRNC